MKHFMVIFGFRDLSKEISIISAIHRIRVFDSVLQVHFKNELVLVLVHFTKKRTFRSFLVLWEKVN